MAYSMGKLMYDEDSCQGVVKVNIQEDVIGLDILSDWIDELQPEYDRIVELMHNGRK